MSLSCTINEILSIISQNLKRSHDCDHAHLRDYLSHTQPFMALLDFVRDYPDKPATER